MKITVFGAGSWGTALSIVLARNGHEVILWARSAERAAQIAQTRHNPVYLKDAILPDSIQITADVTKAASNRELWVMATPSQSVRELAATLHPFTDAKLVIVSVAKGIENGTLKTATEVLREVFPQVPSTQIGVLYGPSHAEEVAKDKPTLVVTAAGSKETATLIQQTFLRPELRVYVNPDLIGVEISGSVKNVLAIAAGISDGLGFGDNTKAAILTRGMAEIRRLGLAMGAKPETFAGLAGIGDLVVTCMSRHSRNRYFGEQIGRGKTREQVEEEMQMVAEGVKTTLSTVALAQKYQVEMPITHAIYQVLFEDKSPRQAVTELMTRTPKEEHDWLSH